MRWAWAAGARSCPRKSCASRGGCTSRHSPAASRAIAPAQHNCRKKSFSRPPPTTNASGHSKTQRPILEFKMKDLLLMTCDKMVRGIAFTFAVRSPRHRGDGQILMRTVEGPHALPRHPVQMYVSIGERQRDQIHLGVPKHELHLL